MTILQCSNTYPAVPAGLVDTCVSSSGLALDMPKSATLAIILPSSRMLLGFTSLWITGGSWIHNAITDHLPHIRHIHMNKEWFSRIYILLCAIPMSCEHITNYLHSNESCQ